MLCTDELSISIFNSLSFFVYSENAPALLYYSHIPAAFVALLVSAFIISKNWHLLAPRVLAAISILYATWAIMDLFVWTKIDSGTVMYLWSFWFSIFALIFILSFYFLYVFIKKRDVPFNIKVPFVIFFLPIISLSSTKFTLSSFSIDGCNAIENPWMIGYTYLYTTIIFFSMLVFSWNNYLKAQIEEKRQILLVSTGIFLFLISFSIATYIPSIMNLFQNSTDTFNIEQYGFFGMTIFIAFLTYVIVEFKTFNIKLIATQALVVSLIILIGSQFFFIKTNTNRILTAITLIITGLIGINLIRSVKKEVELRESLQVANEGQSNLIHIMNHQIKGYLSKSRNIFAELLSENGYGINDESRPMIKEGFESLTEGVGFVQQVLNGSSAETGTLVYAKNRFDMRELVEETVQGQKTSAEKAGLTYELKIDNGDYKIIGDNVQLKECVRNLIDNSIRYTPSGGLKIHLSKNEGKILFSIEDTGVGIAPEDKPKLFTKGGRGRDSLKININSTGYGLAFVKAVAEAHNGRVWVDSKGTNQGSTFYMELPVSNS